MNQTSKDVPSSVGDQSKIESVTREYLRVRKQWNPSDYRVEIKGATADGRAIIVWVIFLDDEKSPKPGSGRSVLLHITPEDYSVVKELRWQ
jgi:hypothetical protein